MPKILILQMRPEDEAAESEFRAILQVGNIDEKNAHRVRLEKPEIPELELNNYSAIIAGGSPFDISCPKEQKSNAQRRVEAFFKLLFEEVLAKDLPFLGACSGNGLLGHYCGVKISNKYAEPVGTANVYLTEEGKKDDLLKELPQHFQALVGHKEACDQLPKGATLLISSPTCPIQMFRLKNNIYATQFHPEADEKEFCLRIDIYRNQGYFDPKEAERLKANLKGVNAPETNEILRRFVEKYVH